MLPLQVRRLLRIGGVKHVDLYAGRNLKSAPKVQPIVVEMSVDVDDEALRRAISRLSRRRANG